MADLTRFLFPEPYVLLGIRVKPFSLGHYLLLFRSGFNIFRNKIESVEQFLFCIYICSRDWEEAWEGIQTMQWVDFCKKHLKFFRKKKINVNEEVKLFYQYINEHSQSVPYWFKTEEYNRTHTSDLQQNEDDLDYIGYVITYAMAELNLPYKDVLRMPIGCLLTLCSYNMARNGVIKIKTSEDEKLLQEAKRLNELWRSGQLEV